MSLPPFFNTVIILVERLSGYTSKSFYNIFKLNERHGVSYIGCYLYIRHSNNKLQRKLAISQLISILS